MKISVNEAPVNQAPVNKILSGGFNLVKIVDFKVKESNKSNKKQLTLLVEGKPNASMDSPFSHKDGYLFGEKVSEGAIGQVDLDIYIDYTTEEALTALATNLRIVAKALNIEDKFMAMLNTDVETVEDLMSKTVNIFSEAGFVYLKLTVEEYIKNNGNIGQKLSIGRFPVKQLDGTYLKYFMATPEDKVLRVDDDGMIQTAHIKESNGLVTRQFNRGNIYDYKKAVKPDTDDMPALPELPSMPDELPY